MAGRVVDRRAAAGRGHRRLVDPHARRREQPAQHQPGDALADVAALAVLRLTALPQRPDAQPEADRGGEVAGHAEPGRPGVDGLAGDQVQLGAETTRRRGGRLGERAADRREGQAAGERDDRQGLDLETRETPLVSGAPGRSVANFHVVFSFNRGNRPSRERVPPAAANGAG